MTQNANINGEKPLPNNITEWGYMCELCFGQVTPFNKPLSNYGGGEVNGCSEVGTLVAKNCRLVSCVRPPPHPVVAVAWFRTHHVVDV